MEKALERSEGRPAEFELIGGHPALDLVNTLDWRFREKGPEELLPAYGDVLRFGGQCRLMSPAQARRLLRNTGTGKAAHVAAEVRRMRECAARIFYAVIGGNDPPPEAIDDLESRHRESGAHRHLSWSDNHLVWEFADIVAPEFPLWMLTLEVVDLLSSDQLRLLRECGDPDCRWLFLDTSKNHTRRWCDMKICGNRMKARRFKAQQRA